MADFDFGKAMAELKKQLKPERYEHSVGVMETASKLAERFGADVYKARVAGILHDCAKNIDKQQSYKMCEERGIELDETVKKSYKLVHQYLGAELAKEQFGIEDESILSAIRCHTTGKENMSTLDKIIYLADFTEPNRDKEPFDGLDELRRLCSADLDEAMLYALDISVYSIMERKMYLHVDTVRARNWFLDKKINKTLENC